jgi:hypothetical protein
MAKKYKIKKENLTEFFTWFTKKNVPPKIEDLINNDPELKKLKVKLDAIIDSSVPEFEKMKKENPKEYQALKSVGLVP